MSQLPVAVGANYFIIESMTDSFGRPVTLTYRVNIHRRQSDDVYYNELYRDQYHYSVKDGWANDPNGFSLHKDVTISSINFTMIPNGGQCTGPCDKPRLATLG